MPMLPEQANGDNHVRFSERPGQTIDDLYTDYVDEQHMQTFAQALHADYFVDIENLDTPRHSPSTLSLASMSQLNPAQPQLSRPPSSINGIPKSPRIRKVSALSDFAPVNVRVKKRKRGMKHHEKRTDWLFMIVRWPLLGFLFLFIFFEFGMYVFVRQCVNAKEWFTAWRGRKGQLRMKLRQARTYGEWKKTALELDDFLGFDEWKAIDEDPYYDWKLVRKVLKSLRQLRKNKDVRGVLGVLETCIRTNFAGVESARLYSETFYGTKELIEDYLSEVENALIYIRESNELSNEEKRKFFKSANMNLGISALCLSGGATFGYYHFGVLKAFADANLLPRVITGTSAGGLVAALAGTRTDAELKHILVPELADRITACEEPFNMWIKRFWKTGARFDSVDWARKACFFTRGSLTFREAYRRTGRILNISVIPADRHSPTKLLNYLNAPDTVIWSALLASAAVPGILNPVVLMQKTKDGNLAPWNWGSKFKDGSLRVDIPLQALNNYFNVTHPVVSQANPHVHLFFFAPRGSAGKPVAHRKGKGNQRWRGNFVLSAAEQWLKLELTKNFKVIRDLDLLPQLLGQDWSSVFLQRFDGTVTIWPKTRVKDWVRILSDPDRQELERMIRVGESVTWPKLHMIENRFRLEREILRGRQAVRRPTQLRERVTPSEEVSSFDPGNLPDTSRGPPVSPESAQVDHSEMGPNDTDTDMPFRYDATDGKLRLRHRNALNESCRDTSGTNTPVNLKSSEDPLRSPARRRMWTSQLLEEGDNQPGASHLQQDYGYGTPDPPAPVPASSTFHTGSFLHLPHLRTGGLLRKLKPKSFPAIPSPFQSFRKFNRQPMTSEQGVVDAWSSDSSDLEDDLDDGSYEPFGLVSRDEDENGQDAMTSSQEFPSEATK